MEHRNYADTSFLVSLYARDTNSPAALALASTFIAPLVLTPLIELEFTNAIELRVFRREISSSQASSVLTPLKNDIRSGVFQSVWNPLSFERALLPMRKHTRQLGSRSLDVLHVAAAMVEANAKMFFTFDKTQAKLAKLEGLTTLP